MSNSEYTSEENVGYSVLSVFLAGDANARRCFVGLSPDEQQRLISGAQSLHTTDEIAGYVWGYLNGQGR